MDTPSCTIPLAAQPLDCCVSPCAGILAAALVTGQLQLASFACPPASQGGGGGGGSQLAYQLQVTVPAPAPQAGDGAQQPSKKKQKKAAAAAAAAGGGGGGEPPSCRACCFTSDGAAVLAGYADHVVRSYDVATGRLVAEFSGEHDAQLSRVFACGPVAPHVFASGDEEGLVALWDARVGGGGATSRYKQHTDYITDFALQAKAQALVVTSGDATLSVHDLRKGKPIARSEDDNDDELLSCAVVKGGRKVVAGTQSGVLHLYSWGYFNDCSDRFPGHPESVQAMVAFDEDTLLTGSSDGGVRVVGVLPNRLLGILGQHNGDFPVERLALSSDRRVLASTSHDSAVKLWDLAVLHDDEDDGGDDDGDGREGDEEDDGGGGGDLASAAVAAVAAAAGRRRSGDEDEDAAERAERRALRGEVPEEGMEGEDEDEDGDEDDEDEDEEYSEDEGEEGLSGSGEGDGSGSDEGEGEEAGGGAPGGRGAARGKKAQGTAAAAGGRGAGEAAAAVGGGVGGDDDDGDDSDDDDSDGGGGGGARQRKRAAKREKTRWTKGVEQKKGGAGNFFADLL